MLYLKPPIEESGTGPMRRVPLGEQTAIRLERALLYDDWAARRRELDGLLAEDEQLAGWALRAAERHLSRTINRVDEAAEWLCGGLEQVLATWLFADAAVTEFEDVQWRLPRLAARLAACAQQFSDFHLRLEHEKIEALKELAYGASHEINNPLANIAARAQTLLMEETDPERQRKLTAIHRQAMRAHEMIADLMLFARPPKLSPAACELGELVGTVVEQMRERAAESNVEVLYEPPGEAIELNADDTQLRVAVQALIANAVEAIGSSGQVRVHVRQTAISGERWAEISVKDDGPGISDETRRHMFDPFYSGREAGRGLGFGLSKCWRIVDEHGGQVIVARPTGGGAQLDIRLPIAAEAIEIQSI